MLNLLYNKKNLIGRLYQYSIFRSVQEIIRNELILSRKEGMDKAVELQSVNIGKIYDMTQKLNEVCGGEKEIGGTGFSNW